MSAHRLFILAGEASGDRIAADLVQRLRNRADFDLHGVGGEALAAEGLSSLFDMQELSVMGWADVLPRLPWLLWRARQVARAIVRTRPDVAVLVDAQVFSAIVAKQVHKAAPDIPVVLCVAPAAWAWKPERAAALKPYFREVLAVLPFEPDFMRSAGGPDTSYIGHPALAQFDQRSAVPDQGPVLLLPGSRVGELRRHLPMMRAVVDALTGHVRVSRFLLPTPGHLRARVAAEVDQWAAPVEIISGEEAKAAAFASSIAAVAVTGTVTLELALAGVPMATTYVADKGQARNWVRYKAKYASLPNIILDTPLVPEILQVEPDPAPLVEVARMLLDDPFASRRQLEGFGRIRELMEQGTPSGGRVDPAERLVHYLK